MNKKYRIMLGIFVGIFTIISIISTIPGVGFIRALLILIAAIILLGIIVGGMYAFGPKIFWWDYFKPSAAVPIAWGLLHLGFAITLPDFSEEIWVTHFKLLLGVELAVFVLNSIVNIKTEFNERFSRKAMTAAYVIFFIFSIGLIFLRITDGETAAKQDRKWYTKMQYSKAVMTAEKIRQNSAEHAINTKTKRLDKLMAKAKNGTLSPAESLEAQTLPKEIKKLASTIPEEKKPQKPQIQKIAKPARRMSGTFTVPAGKGPEETKVWINPREIVWIAANPSAKLLNCKSGRTIEIGSEGWTSPLIKKKGNLIFLKGPKPIQVDYSIIN